MISYRAIVSREPCVDKTEMNNNIFIFHFEALHKISNSLLRGVGITGSGNKMGGGGGGKERGGVKMAITVSKTLLICIEGC